MFINHIYLIYMNKPDLVINNLNDSVMKKNSKIVFI